MKQNLAIEQFLAGRRVVIAKFVAHHHKEVQNKTRKPAGVVNLRSSLRGQAVNTGIVSLLSLL